MLRNERFQNQNGILENDRETNENKEREIESDHIWAVSLDGQGDISPVWERERELTNARYIFFYPKIPFSRLLSLPLVFI